jgi:hypothetical protein
LFDDEYKFEDVDIIDEESIQDRDPLLGKSFISPYGFIFLSAEDFRRKLWKKKILPPLFSKPLNRIQKSGILYSRSFYPIEKDIGKVKAEEKKSAQVFDPLKDLRAMGSGFSLTNASTVTAGFF